MSSTQNELMLSVLTPGRILLSQEAMKSITLTTAEGQVQILPGHQSYIGILEPGIFRFDGEKKEKSLSGVISSGSVEVQGAAVIVTAETLELSTEIDLSRAEKAEKGAKEVLSGQSKPLDSENFEKHQLKLRRALIRQQAAKTK